MVAELGEHVSFPEDGCGVCSWQDVRDEHALVGILHSASFLAEVYVSSPRKSFLFITWKIFSGSKYPKNVLINFEKGSTDPAHI